MYAANPNVLAARDTLLLFVLLTTTNAAPAILAAPCPMYRRSPFVRCPRSSHPLLSVYHATFYQRTVEVLHNFYRYPYAMRRTLYWGVQMKHCLLCIYPHMSIVSSARG
ncbi:hypothetical protein FA95DRAFT_868210 [Auriscalpium vulgare]|uniref:Uncharacterized protein n=1 Tax=Auriscalpium vulgare TaxID=40419 RepID=A0ACB8RA08_9AGAM|nr:hypothetical protein FA95DRAFT_868210 [Auriscalpium vulgare]